MIRHLLSVNRLPPNIPIYMLAAIVDSIIPRIVPTQVGASRVQRRDNGAQ
jgi:hypothetical protein